MDKYKIFITDEFASGLESDFKGHQAKIKKKLEEYVYPQLRQNPHFGNNIKKLRDFTPPTWRYRIGDYRFFYEIDEKDRLVIMISADNRKDAY